MPAESRHIRSIGRGARGANLVEYVILVGAIALFAVFGSISFGSSVRTKAELQAACVSTLESCGGSNDTDGPVTGEGAVPAPSTPASPPSLLSQVGQSLSAVVTGPAKWAYNSVADLAGMVNAPIDWALRGLGSDFQFGTPPRVALNPYERSASYAMDTVTFVSGAATLGPKVAAKLIVAYDASRAFLEGRGLASAVEAANAAERAIEAGRAAEAGAAEARNAARAFKPASGTPLPRGIQNALGTEGLQLGSMADGKALAVIKDQRLLADPAVQKRISDATAHVADLVAKRERLGTLCRLRAAEAVDSGLGSNVYEITKPKAPGISGYGFHDIAGGPVQTASGRTVYVAFDPTARAYVLAGHASGPDTVAFVAESEAELQSMVSTFYKGPTKNMEYTPGTIRELAVKAKRYGPRPH